jgi:hypothetical protein
VFQNPELFGTQVSLSPEQSTLEMITFFLGYTRFLFTIGKRDKDLWVSAMFELPPDSCATISTCNSTAKHDDGTIFFTYDWMFSVEFNKDQLCIKFQADTKIKYQYCSRDKVQTKSLHH